jgi:NAD/NADP transhydrogenase beta subunit
MAEYDPKILQQFADQLYSQARSQIAAWTVRSVIVGFIVAVVLVALEPVLRQETVVWMLLGILIGAYIGVVIGRRRAFQLRLEAQRTLCQLQVEKNTRPKP